MKISREFRIGIFVTVILLVSFILINFLRGKDIFNREMSVSSHYDDVAGLVPSASVYIKGYKAGTVTDVEYDPESGLFEVTCSVLRKLRIPEDSRMTIYSVDIMGGKGIRIDAGSSEVCAEDGAELVPCFEEDLMTSLSAGIGPLAAKVSSTLDSLNTAVGSINTLLAAADPGSLRRILDHIECTAANVEGISDRINGKSEELVSFIGHLDSVAEKLGSVMDKADAAMTDIGGITAALDSSDVAGLVVSFRSLLDSMQDPDGSLGKLLTDGSVYDSLDAILADVDRLVRKIEENPKKYIRISVF